MANQVERESLNAALFLLDSCNSLLHEALEGKPDLESEKIFQTLSKVIDAFELLLDLLKDLSPNGCPTESAKAEELARVYNNLIDSLTSLNSSPTPFSVSLPGTSVAIQIREIQDKLRRIKETSRAGTCAPGVRPFC